VRFSTVVRSWVAPIAVLCACCAERGLHDAGAPEGRTMTGDASGSDSGADEDGSAVMCTSSAYRVLNCEGLVPAFKQFAAERVDAPQCGDPIAGARHQQVIRDSECLREVVAYVCPAYDQGPEYRAIDLSTHMVALILSLPASCDGTITVSTVERCGDLSGSTTRTACLGTQPAPASATGTSLGVAWWRSPGRREYQPKKQVPVFPRKHPAGGRSRGACRCWC